MRRLPQMVGSAPPGHTGWVWVARARDRVEEALDALRDDPLQSPWLDAAQAVAAGDFREAADVMAGSARCRSRCSIACAQRGSGCRRTAGGRQAEADEQLRPAPAFYRGVGATRFVREGGVVAGGIGIGLALKWPSLSYACARN